MGIAVREILLVSFTVGQNVTVVHLDRQTNTLQVSKKKIKKKREKKQVSSFGGGAINKKKIFYQNKISIYIYYFFAQ